MAGGVTKKAELYCSRLGLLRFPVTPTVSFQKTANYDNYDVVHTNYQFPAYKNTHVSNITINGKFTSETISEAARNRDAFLYLRAAQNMDFNGTGSPPPVLEFNYLGPTMFRRTPVVITSLNTTFPDDVDYVKVDADWVPIIIEYQVTMHPVYSPQKQAQEFSFGAFASGSLVSRGYQ